MTGLGFAMAMQFKPDGRGGFVYRKDQKGPPLPATREERDRYVRWYGWIVISSVFVLSGLIMLGATVAWKIEPNPSDLGGAFGALIFGGGSMVLTYLYLKWFSHAPARAFADRAGS